MEAAGAAGQALQGVAATLATGTEAELAAAEVEAGPTAPSSRVAISCAEGCGPAVPRTRCAKISNGSSGVVASWTRSAASLTGVEVTGLVEAGSAVPVEGGCSSMRFRILG